MYSVAKKRFRPRLMKLSFIAISAFILTAMPSVALAASIQQAGTEQDAYRAAANEFHVPEALLLAIAYNQSRFESHTGLQSADGGFGPMNLRTASLVEDGRGDPSRPVAKGKMTTGDFTLDKAAALLHVPAETLKRDSTQNIRGAAAVLAEQAKQLHAGVLPTNPQDWYTAVAKFSGSKDTASAAAFADDVYATAKSGVSVKTSQGQQLTLPATANFDAPDQAQAKSSFSALGLRDTGLSKRTSDGSECPSNLNCRFVSAGYAANSADPADYGNYDHSNRPKDMKIKYIIIHDTEGSYNSAISHYQDTTSYVSAHYTIRSSDGAITQSVSTKDTAWHAGDWYVNMHSIGIEHEGIAALGSAWYTEAMYRSSADLVRYLAKKYDIPLDREHIIGHDNVPGLNDLRAAQMHYDPGPYWDWNHYMDLIQNKPAGTNAGTTAPRDLRAGKVISINPQFSQNVQTVHACKDGTCADLTAPSNFVYFRTQPRADAPFITDPLLHPGGEGGSGNIDDWTAKAASGQHYVVADRQGDWTAVWHTGQKAWFYNPASKPVADLVRGAKTITLKPGLAETNMYGGAYPEMSVYPTGVNGPIQPKLSYKIKAGQQYASDSVVPTDYFYDATIDSSLPHDHEIFKGNEKYIKLWYNQRVMFVKANDVIVQ